MEGSGVLPIPDPPLGKPTRAPLGVATVAHTGAGVSMGGELCKPRIPLPSKSSKDSARGLSEQVLSRYGTPGEVLTDQGWESMCKFEILLGKHEITHRLVSREHPQSNGFAERMVQTTKRALRNCLLDGGAKDSDELLPYVAMGYKMSKQKAVAYSP